MRVPWKFNSINSDDVDEYIFAINPLESTVPSLAKTMTSSSTTAGRNIVFQGRDAIGTLSCSGTILYQAHYEKLLEWAQKEKQVKITDDLNNSYWVFITSFTPTRQPSSSHPWRHEFSLEATVLDWS